MKQSSSAAANPSPTSSGAASWALAPFVYAGIFLTAFTAFFVFLARRGIAVHRENGPMENFQAACILIGAGFLASATRRAARGERILFSGLALLFVSFVVLEVDVRPFGIHILTLFFNGPVRDIWMALLWMVAFVWFWRSRTVTLLAFRQWLRSPGGVLLVLAAVPWFTSTVIDKLHLVSPKPRSLLVEELLEINAAVLMFASACKTWSTRRRARVKTPE